MQRGLTEWREERRLVPDSDLRRDILEKFISHWNAGNKVRLDLRAEVEGGTDCESSDYCFKACKRCHCKC